MPSSRCQHKTNSMASLEVLCLRVLCQGFFVCFKPYRSGCVCWLLVSCIYEIPMCMNMCVSVSIYVSSTFSLALLLLFYYIIII